MQSATWNFVSQVAFFFMVKTGTVVLFHHVPEGTDIVQFLEIGFVFHVQDDILRPLNLGLG